MAKKIMVAALIIIVAILWLKPDLMEWVMITKPDPDNVRLYDEKTSHLCDSQDRLILNCHLETGCTCVTPKEFEKQRAGAH
jgi:hypothetical protein